MHAAEILLAVLFSLTAFAALAFRRRSLDESARAADLERRHAELLAAYRALYDEYATLAGGGDGDGTDGDGGPRWSGGSPVPETNGSCGHCGGAEVGPDDEEDDDDGDEWKRGGR